MGNKENKKSKSTITSEYTRSLSRKQMKWWKQLLNVQAPYRWNLLRLHPGFTLDIGCGIGRNLHHLSGQGIGIDHNQNSVKLANEQGFLAFTPEDFSLSDYNIPERFDSLLLAHVAEHMIESEVIELLRTYLPNLKNGGKLILITPQEAGYRSDITHIQFISLLEHRSIAKKLKLIVKKEYSFPFPRVVGQFFLYNEFVSVSYKLN